MNRHANAIHCDMVLRLGTWRTIGERLRQRGPFQPTVAQVGTTNSPATGFKRIRCQDLCLAMIISSPESMNRGDDTDHGARVTGGEG
jgi:hypothetical protein